MYDLLWLYYFIEISENLKVVVILSMVGLLLGGIAGVIGGAIHRDVHNWNKDSDEYKQGIWLQKIGVKVFLSAIPLVFLIVVWPSQFLLTMYTGVKAGEELIQNEDVSEILELSKAKLNNM